DQPPPNTPTAEGKPLNAEKTIWGVKLPALEKKGQTDVSVVLLSGAGQPASKTVTIEILDAAELAKPKPGKVTGTVVEGTLAQPGLEVVLRDEKGMEKKTKSDADGKFVFEDVPPGKYKVSSSKETSGRKGSKDVEVNPGAPTDVTLELFL